MILRAPARNVDSGKIVDHVLVPGAGGAIVSAPVQLPLQDRIDFPKVLDHIETIALLAPALNGGAQDLRGVALVGHGAN